MSPTVAERQEREPAAARRVPARPATVPPPSAAPGRAAGALRVLGFLVLLVQGSLAWGRQLAPAADRVAWQGAGVAVAVAAAVAAAGRLERLGPRRAAVTVVCSLGALAALPAAGIPVELLGWRNWDVLAGGVGEGLGALPDLNVPYRGLAEWVRWIIMVGAGLLAVLAAGLAFAPATPGRRARRSLGAAAALAVLYGVAVVERDPDAPYRSGMVWAAGLALFLGAGRLADVKSPPARLVAVVCALAAVAFAGLLAPRLDGGRPLLDYRSFTAGLATGKQDAFDWNHSYSPLRWPRDGRELLRVKATSAAYWKATALPRFDGERWVQSGAGDPGLVDTPLPRNHPSWYQDIDVTVRALRSTQYLTAGYAGRIFNQPRDAMAVGSGSYRTVGQPLKSGDTYSASVYVPRPTSRELRDAGTVYPDYVLPSLKMELPASVGGPTVGGGRTTTIEFAPFGASAQPATAYPSSPAGSADGGDLLARSGYRRTWALAQGLRAAASSPFALVRSVRRRVQQGALYTETPKQGRVPLDAFLWDTHEGYCQQFSGAMALVLRMAGVPARVASGFAPGQFDADRRSYVVRDLDAHSWVEAFFPDIGWVTFDPTPTVAPPSSQDAGDGGDTSGDAGRADSSPRADTAKAPGGPGGVSARATTTSGGPSLLPWLLVAVAAGLATAGLWWRRGRVAPGALEELRRALVRSGRPATGGLTLQGLERSLAGSPAAQGYVRALREARYAGADATPDRGARSALRRELAAGLGAAGRLRSWWALPPRPGR